MAKVKNATIYAKDGIRVEGLREFQQAIAAVSKETAKQNRVQYKRIAEHVASIARGKIEHNISGDAARAIKGMGTNAGASVRFPAGGAGSGSDAVGYYPWLDFGGAPATGRGVTSTGRSQFGSGIRRGVIKEGRYIYPAITESRDYIVEQAGDIVTDAARAQQFDVRG